MGGRCGVCTAATLWIRLAVSRESPTTAESEGSRTSWIARDAGLIIFEIVGTPVSPDQNADFYRVKFPNG